MELARGLKPFAELPHISELELNGISVDLSELSCLRNLESLDLKGSHISNESELSKLTYLKRLKSK